jgi:hypothetical protein
LNNQQNTESHQNMMRKLKENHENNMQEYEENHELMKKNNKKLVFFFYLFCNLAVPFLIETVNK